MTKASEALKAKHREYLLESLRPGDTVWCVLRNVSASGMSRTISMFLFRADGANVEVSQVHYNAAKVLGWRYSRRHEGVCVQGCGMDMGFHLVDVLSHTLGWKGKDAIKHRWL